MDAHHAVCLLVEAGNDIQDIAAGVVAFLPIRESQ